MSSRLELSPQKQLLLQKHLQGAGMRAAGVEPRRPNDAVPISAEQKNVWLHAAMAPDVPLYNESLTIHRFGSFDRAALERSFIELVRRHEIWRTSFQMVDGELQQLVHPDLSIEIPFTDVSDLPIDQREKAALEIATADARRPFDLSRSPLLRARIVRLAPDNHGLYVTLHHIIFDGVSIYRVVVPQLAALYSAFARGEQPNNPPPRLQYGDYALWRERQLADNRMGRELEYWRDRLSGELPVTRLPTDRPRPAQSTHRGSMETFTLSTALTESLKELSRNQGVTLYVVLLAAFKALLHRYTGQDDIVIGGVTDMRRRPELAEVVGYFLNSLPFRTQPSSAMSFRNYLSDVQDTVVGALDASSVPFDRLVREFKPKREGGTHPIFQILFSVEPPPPLIDEGWDLTQMDVTVGIAKFDLYLELDERPEGIIGRFLYSTDLFDAGTIRRMIGHWTTVLQAVVSDPLCALGRLPLLTAEESQTLLVQTNTTARDCPQTTVWQWFEAQAAKTPEAVAVECDRRTWRYRELRQRATMLAAQLRQAGVRRGSLVGIMLDRSFDMVAGLLAIMKAGGGYLPLDPRLPAARLAMLVEDAAPAVLLTQRTLVERVPQSNARVVVADAEHPVDVTFGYDPECSAGDLAYLLYTSGSTGKPKAVEVSHGSLTNILAAIRDELRFGARETLLAVTTLSFDIAALELFLPLVTGARLALASHEDAGDPTRLKALMSASRCTTMQATPATWRGLIAAGWAGSKGCKILCGGEALQHDLAAQLLDRCETLWNVYGPTETTIWSLIHKVDHNDNPVPIGRPIANTRVYVLDRNGEPVPAGVPGELFIGGAGVALGYRNAPLLTEQKFCSFPKLTTDRLYRTGDVVRFRSDGLLEFLGRDDNQVKVRGFRVGLEEVEAAICSHPDVAAAAVRAFADASGESRLMAFVVPKTARKDGDLELSRFLSQHLPAYMVPSQCIVMPSLPMTANGKIDRSRLQLPPPERKSAASEPTDDLERMLLRIWQELLGISNIDVHDNFFELGGHSLLAAMLAAEIQKVRGCPLPLAALFRAPTIASLAELLRSNDEPEFSHLVLLRAHGPARPLFIVHGMFGNVVQLHGLAERLDTDRRIYGLQARGADLRLQPHATTSEMAAAYTSAIREVQPNGPYALAGYSFGGLIAYEMACQLRAAGEQVDVLALFDTDVHYSNLLLIERVIHHCSLVGRVVRKLKILHPREWAAYLLSKLTMIRSLLSARPDIGNSEPRPIEMPDAIAARNLELYWICMREFEAYRPQRLAGRVAMFRTVHPRFDMYDPLPFWKRLTDGVDVFTVAGTHGTIMDKRHVGSVAGQLSRYLAAVDQGKEASCPVAGAAVSEKSRQQVAT